MKRIKNLVCKGVSLPSGLTIRKRLSAWNCPPVIHENLRKDEQPVDRTRVKEESPVAGKKGTQDSMDTGQRGRRGEE